MAREVLDAGRTRSRRSPNRGRDSAEVLYRHSLVATLAYGDPSEAVWEVDGRAISAG